MVQTIGKTKYNTIPGKAQDKPFVLNAKDDKILKAVYFYRGLTVEQITYLIFSIDRRIHTDQNFSSITYVRDRLAKLAKYEYLHRYQYPTLSLGVSPWVYELGSLGLKYLRLLEDFDVASRFRDTEDEERGYGAVKHLLSLNDLLIAGELLTTTQPSITLTNRLHDWMLHKEPLKTKVNRIEVTIIPDAFLHFHVTHGATTYSMPIWIELDRGSEFGKRIRDKLTAIIAIVASQGYQDLFAASDITVAFAALDDKRRDLLRSYVKERLQSMRLTNLDQLFLFACLPYAMDGKSKTAYIEPTSAYLSPIWFPADDSVSPISLLELGN